MRFNRPNVFQTLGLGIEVKQPPKASAFARRRFSRFYVQPTNKPTGGILRRINDWSDRGLEVFRSMTMTMPIYGPAQLHGAQGLQAPHTNRINPPSTPAVSTHIDTTDELQLSPAAQMAGKLSEIPDIRWERVNQIKAAIADGTYMTDEKMGVALDRLLDEIA
jgi:negative regulator of flagellin synthesis FlgM